MSWLIKGLFLLAYYVHGYADVSRYRECFESGTNPETIVRQTPMRIWYSLEKTGIKNYKGFPELNDKFYLKTAQRVRIEYKILTRLPEAVLLWTRLKVDDKVQNQFNDATTYTIERTNRASGLLWLQKGWHEVKVQYVSNTATHQPPNGHSYQFSHLLIEYLDFSSNQTD